MGLGILVFFAGAAAAGYYGVRKLKGIEEEIRRESRPVTPKPSPPKRTPDVKSPVPQPKKEDAIKPSPSPPPLPVRELSLEYRILAAINEKPGLLQTDLYALFPDQDKKAMQGLLLEMNREGKITREKEKSTYKVFAVPGN